MRFGFSGSRALPASFAPLVAEVISSLPAGAEVLVGDAKGLDALVRALCPGARVFRPAFAGRGGFAARSAALVKEADVLLVFVLLPCPAAVKPSRSFRGFGSGSWGSAALAVGLGKKVRVFWCGPGPAVLPAWAAAFQKNFF